MPTIKAIDPIYSKNVNKPLRRISEARAHCSEFKVAGARSQNNKFPDSIASAHARIYATRNLRINSAKEGCKTRMMGIMTPI